MFKVSKFLLIFALLCVCCMMPSKVYAIDTAGSQQRVTEIKNEISVLEEEREKCEVLKEQAHKIAESARSKGLDETGEVITCAKVVWGKNDARINEIDSQLKVLRVELEEKEVLSKLSYVGDFKLTGYCACQRCCGKSPSNPGYGVTAMGTRATEGRTIAMDKRFAFGTKVYIEGLGLRTVEDRGGAIKGNRIDVYSNTHSGCYAPEFNRTAKVYIVG